MGSVRRRTDGTPHVWHAHKMDWTAAAVEWLHFKHEVRAEWKNLTDVQLDAIGGVRARLGEQIRSSYGVTPEEAERQICYFEARNEYFLPVSSR
jgi:hypothetical protein